MLFEAHPFAPPGSTCLLQEVFSKVEPIGEKRSSQMGALPPEAALIGCVFNRYR